jgi:hypothetical protein
MVVLDTAQISAFGSAESPSYDGLWQIAGHFVAQVVSSLRDGMEMQYVFVEGPTLWRFDSTTTCDTDTGTDIPITSRLVTRCMNFGNQVDLKQLQYGELWASGLTDDTEFTLWFRPSGHPLWTVFGTKQVAVDGSSGYAQRRRKLRINPLDYTLIACDPVTSEALRSAQSFQFALGWTGNATIEAFRVVADAVPDTIPEPCDEDVDEAEVVSATANAVALEDYL